MGMTSWKCIALLSCYFIFGWLNVSEFHFYSSSSLSEKPSQLQPQQQQTHHHSYTATLDDNDASTAMGIPKQFDTNNRYGVVGVLSSSSPGYEYKRMAQRATWVKDAPLYNVKVYFLIDRPDPSLDREQMLYGDLVYLNATYSGRAVRFGEKLYLWYKMAHELHPEAAFVAKVDDDCVVCSNVMWPFVWEHVTPTSYIGWMHHFHDGFNRTNMTEAANQIGKWYRMDEFFVVIGNALVDRIVKRQYCHEQTETCNSNINNGGLVDLDYGGASLGLWLSTYADILNITTLNDFSQHRTIQFPMLKETNLDPLKYVCPRFPFVHFVKDPLAHLPIYNNSAQPISVKPQVQYDDGQNGKQKRRRMMKQKY